ncbi:hypothetical protein NQ317_001048 [Molorchus minor]|uniref:Uncharacterized protein n=1 Tax=Molorchus minor TaxID=1323400 RepID=A0ABQ9JT41_9CUCU|nr:hypothetical protein NQ317_001048 [Molorchus minor]
MCLRRFRGRFVQKELPFRKRVIPEKESPRVTRSGLSTKINARRQKMKKIILLSTPNATVKPRSLRSTTMKKTVLSQRKSKSLKTKQKGKAQQQLKVMLAGKKHINNEAVKSTEGQKNSSGLKRNVKSVENKKNIVKTVDLKKEMNKTVDIKRSMDIKRESNKANEKDTRQVSKTLDLKKELNRSTDIKKEFDIKKVNNKVVDKNETSCKNTSKEFTKSTELKKETRNIHIALGKPLSIKKDTSTSMQKNKKETVKSTENVKRVNNRRSMENKSATPPTDKPTKKTVNSTPNLPADKALNKNIIDSETDAKHVAEIVSKKEGVDKKVANKSGNVITKKECPNNKDADSLKSELVKSGVNKNKKETSKREEIPLKKDLVRKKGTETSEDEPTIPKMAQRPSRKTKEAAAIYMEILSHKLVNDSQIDDDDNVSIDSFPELPNVKKTEQRENELKAQAKSSKDEIKEKFKITDTEISADKSSSGVVEQIKTKSSSNIPIKMNIEEKKLIEKSKFKKINNEDTIEDLKPIKTVKSEPALLVLSEKLTAEKSQLKSENETKRATKIYEKVMLKNKQYLT